MKELKSLEGTEEQLLIKEPLLDNEQPFFRKYRIYIIIASIILLAIIITVLCVLLIKDDVV